MSWTPKDLADYEARQRRPATAMPPPSPSPPRPLVARNTGRWLEELIANSAARYAAAHVLTLKKVEPACKIIGTGNARRVIFLENDWLDFAGCWTERGARHLVVETKSTEGDRLPIMQSESSLTERQCRCLRAWYDEGSAALILWGNTRTGKVLAVPVGSLFKAIAEGRRHLRPEDGVECPLFGLALCDFAPWLRRFHP